MKRFFALNAFLFLCFAFPAEGGGFDAQRRQMVEEVLADTAATSSYSGSSALSPEVVAALGKVQRHRFVPTALAPVAYLNPSSGYERSTASRR